MESLLVIIPVYKHFDYATQAVESLFKNTVSVEPNVYVIDDATPGCSDVISRPFIDIIQNIPQKNTWIEHFTENGGCIRSYNIGLAQARCLNMTYCCVCDSDVIFPHGWDIALARALNQGYSLVGPVTNAPGTERKQNITNFYKYYHLTDDKPSINQVSELLIDRYIQQDGKPVVYESNLNGFCMLSKTKTWFDNAFDDDHVLNPYNEFNSKGQKNPTPLMTLWEYEFQARLHKNNLKSGFCPGSFVFHYRSVSRGDRFRSSGSYRRK